MAMTNARVVQVFDDLIGDLRQIIERHQITHDEYRQIVGFLVEVGQSGEIPLMMDVFLESTVDRLEHADAQASPTAIEGPFYVPDPPLLEPPYVLPMRPDEPGDPLIFSGTLRSTEGEPLTGALLDMWHSDNNGAYSGFQPGPPPLNLRGRFTADDEGRFEVRSIVPVPYEIPKGGPTGRLLALLGRHAFRPAHLHLKITHEHVEPMTTQIFFEGDPWLDSDVADAVKPGLIIPLERHDDPREVERSGLGRPYVTARYDFVLRPRARVAAAV
jgi:catechol 1,2-dioxygenase